VATWSAPGKVFLFGEHAVVYGKPGIAMAIKPRVYVSVRKGRHPPRVKSPYIENCFQEMGVKGSVYVHSQLPSSSGLGSSAAVTVSTLAAINDEFGIDLGRNEIADIAYKIEKKVQGGRASATDTYVSTIGGIVLIKGDSKRRLAPQTLHLVIGNTLVSHSTSKMVERVGTFRKTDPRIVDPIFESIDALTTKALHCLSDPKKLGACMDINHALLDALGVGHPMLTRLVMAARSAGAYGAKLTGAGGGGCMVALCPKRSKSKIAGAMEACDGRAIITTIDTEGVRKENEQKGHRKTGRQYSHG
jgi:mevalonate kinase